MEARLTPCGYFRKDCPPCRHGPVLGHLAQRPVSGVQAGFHSAPVILTGHPHAGHSLHDAIRSRVLLLRRSRVCACAVVSHSVWSRGLQPLSLGFPRQEDWSELPFPPPGNLPDPGVKLESPVSPALARAFFTTIATWEAPQKDPNPLT